MIALEYEGNNMVEVTCDGISLGSHYVNSSIGLSRLLNDLKATPDGLENVLNNSDMIRIGQYMSMFDQYTRMWVPV